MTALAGLAFFLGVLGFAGWAIASTLAPRLDRIAALLGHAPSGEVVPFPADRVRLVRAPLRRAA